MFFKVARVGLSMVVIYSFNVAEYADVLQLCRLPIKTNKKRGIVKM